MSKNICEALFHVPSFGPGIGIRLLDVRKGLVTAIKKEKNNKVKKQLELFEKAIQIVCDYGLIHQKVIITGLEVMLDNARKENKI